MLGEKIIVVDLNAGSYLDKFVGLEKFNLSKNKLDGMYYAYVPYDDRVDISNIQKGAKESVSGVLVVYVQKKNNTTNREIIAYCENATVFSSPQPGEKLNRFFEDNDGKVKCATYSIKSDNLTDLSSLQQKFTIQLSDYNPYLFRSQRSYLTDYPQLKSDIINYIVENKKIELDTNFEQINIQRVMAATPEVSAEYNKNPDEIIQTSSGMQIKKNPTIAKKVLKDNDYKCLCNKNHITFITSNGFEYMEGHHLIPCTVENSEKFKVFSKLDCEENIVCICPTCHRAVHYGNDQVKKERLEILFEKQKSQLESVGIVITLSDLFDLYM